MTQHTINVPFDGFYQSWHNDLIDDELASIHDVDTISDLPDDTYDKYDMRKIYLAYAKVYVDALNQYIENEEGLKLDLKFKELISPREYNFSTDVIAVTISTKHLKALTELTNHERLHQLVKEAGTPRSGYMPLVSPDIHKWGQPVKDWTPSQLELLIQSLDCMNNPDYPVALNIMDSPRANGEIHNVIYEGKN